MDTFHHQHLAFVQTQLPATLHTLTCGEVIAWQFNLLTTEQRVHLLSQQWQVQGVQVLEVVITCGITGSKLTVQEIVVERDGNRFDAIHSQLHREALTRGGLTT